MKCWWENCSAQFLAILCRFQPLEYVLSDQYGENILLVIFAIMKKITKSSYKIDAYRKEL